MAATFLAFVLVVVTASTIWDGGVRAAAAAPAGRPGGALAARQLAAGAGHACLPADHGPASVDWSALSNPILSDRRAGVKDQAMVWAGVWHLLFSFVTDDPTSPGGVRWSIATSTSPDLRQWSRPVVWAGQSGALGVASPDIVRLPGVGYVVTYQSDPGSSTEPAVQDRLYYRSSRDLRQWSAPRPLAGALAPAPGDRMIDGALVDTGHQLLLGFKYSSPTQPQVFEVARSTTGRLQGPWVLVGRPDITVNGDTIENYEFVWLAGQWHLVATSNTLDQPWLFTLAGDPRSPAGWLHWTGGYQLSVPSQAFNTGPGLSSVTFEHANSAFICDATALPGHFYYLTYAGSPELTRFGGWGHAEIGIARSTDLVHWQVPPG